MDYIEENIPLAQFTTFGVGGRARFFTNVQSRERLLEVVHWARDENISVYILGGGSNTLISDDGYDGLVVQMNIPGITFCDDNTGTVALVCAGAGVKWDELVHRATAKGLWGVENLAGIPGTVGAAPVQNIGAYGMELSDTFVSANVVAIHDGQHLKIDFEQAQFSYRESIFKKDSSLIVTDVTLRLSYKQEIHKTYSDLEIARTHGAVLNTSLAIADTIRDIRSQKFITSNDEGTAGSFFKNPVVSQKEYDRLRKRFDGLPGFKVHNGIKIPLAWILDNVLHLRGFKRGNIYLSQHQPLVLIARVPATEKEINTFAYLIASRVKKETGLIIEREVRLCENKNNLC